jgi:hypothetical protein
MGRPQCAAPLAAARPIRLRRLTSETASPPLRTAVSAAQGRISKNNKWTAKCLTSQRLSTIHAPRNRSRINEPRSPLEGTSAFYFRKEFKQRWDENNRHGGIEHDSTDASEPIERITLARQGWPGIWRVSGNSNTCVDRKMRNPRALQIIILCIEQH